TVDTNYRLVRKPRQVEWQIGINATVDRSIHHNPALLAVQHFLMTRCEDLNVLYRDLLRTKLNSRPSWIDEVDWHRDRPRLVKMIKSLRSAADQMYRKYLRDAKNDLLTSLV